MGYIAIFVLFILAIIHLFIFVAEVFLWTKPIGLKMFNMNEDHAQLTKVNAINQGFYNFFLAAGILYSLRYEDVLTAMFFSLCIFIAGIVGGITVKKKILLVQSLPAFIAIVLLQLGV
ncbi:DUF1304 domain-containing protein [Spirochaeta cellobiosiphila]|uniref:DUF1304 domain-containing protein n=1 Tax=Spirochaeta cellobiosiphila TaxID=504483 RepID=UPI0004219351|nr:DUF1304 domain-containing protein [Spirochaeta cellobiosiphila]